jgi:hydrogenase-4 component B
MVSAGAILLLLLLAAAALTYRARLAGLPLSHSETWGCGYLAPKPRMQYTSSSFAATLTSLFSGILRTHSKRPEIIGYFPKKSSFRSHVPEALLEGVYLPLFNNANGRLSLLRKLQNGKLYLYILYIVVTLVALLIWSHFRTRS